MANTKIIGLMSGTSADGVDAALVEFQSAHSVSVIETEYTPFSNALRSSINELAHHPERIQQREDSPLHTELADVYANASIALLKKAGTAAHEVACIANHGQTVRHEPNANPPFSLQLGDPQRIANLTGLPVTANFRQADLIAGGQGAPLMPAFHSALFGQKKGSRHSVVLNLGGIANITKLDNPVLGYDTGPANTLMNQWIDKCLGKPFDEDGNWAASGSIIPSLLERWLSDPYFQLSAPKSTGPDYFNLKWMGDVAKHKPEDVQATLLQLTVESIANELNRSEEEEGNLYACGGGASNAHLMTQLARALPRYQVQKTDELGLPADWVEAAGFAWLGYCKLNKLNSNLPSVTGASEAVVLGEYFEPQGS